MPVPILCDWCHEGRFQVQGPDAYACQACGNRTTGAAMPVGGDERLVVIAGILQVMTVPDGHQVITPDRRCYAPHLGASLALALCLYRTRATFPHTAAVAAAEDLLTVLDADQCGPWVFSPEQLDALIRAMDVRQAALPSSARQHPAFDAEIRNAHARSRRTPRS
ncbi:hypothetical protein [Streptomyces sp. NBC_00687]|uniref:hypothetical protein n=1 Tax=Streptomyces sp. NBC_00687 TaxID=2975807 RepID=UPI00225B935B|nr:hypothetical protein [Streptomyces sp. NBC_00687]MCX4919837.1 hypothetical protein [Streptomyces sp. NBC_00687]